MRKLFLSIAMAGLGYLGMSQENAASVSTGDLFVINKEHNVPFTNLDFPKPNFIKKNGGILNYKNLDGMTVKVLSISEGKNGNQEVTLHH